jgi:hypothetical protein
MSQSVTYVRLGRLAWVGPLTIFASVGAVLLVRALSVGLLHPPRSFTPLLLPPPIIDTVVLVTGAVFVFTFVATMAFNPVRRFRWIAGIVLLVSFVPDILLAVWHSFGGGWPEAIALMTMHVTAWAVTVTMLTRLTTATHDAPDVSAEDSV